MMRGAAAGALGVFGAATYGLGFGLLLHKGTREFVTRNLLFKRFLIPNNVAPNVVEAFRILDPAATLITVSTLAASCREKPASGRCESLRHSEPLRFGTPPFLLHPILLIFIGCRD